MDVFWYHNLPCSLVYVVLRYPFVGLKFQNALNLIFLSTVDTSLVKQVVESCLWNLMVMFMDDVRYFQSFTIFTTNSYRHRTLHLECTETTFLPGVRIREDKRGAHRLTQLYFAKTVNQFS
jgi:hypothetical protein